MKGDNKMAKATIDDFGRAVEYFNHMENNGVTHVALLWIINGDQFYGAIYKRETVLDHLIRVDSDKLLQCHAGTRLKPLQTRTYGKARNMAMLALWNAAERIYSVPTKEGSSIFEQATATVFNGRWTGGEKGHKWDVETDTMKIECKGQQGLVDLAEMKRREGK